MRFDRNGAALLLLCVLTPGVSIAQQNKPSSDAAVRTTKAATQPKPLLIGADDGLSVISAALDARSRLSAKTDCSHLVHDIYERAGFSYDYVSSADLYVGIDEFRRVTRPQPGDLVVWPGHVGIVISPAQHSFYSALSTGLGVDAYDSAYWKQRGRARFFRFVQADSTTTRASRTRAPSLTPAALERTPAVRPLDLEPEDRAGADPRPANPAIDSVNFQVPRMQVIESARPSSEQVSKALLLALSQTAEALREQNVFTQARPLVVVSRFEVQRVKIKGDQGWAEVRINESARLAAGQSNLKKRQVKQRWALRRRDQKTWEVMLPEAALYLNQNSVVQMLARQLAAMTEAADESSNVRQKAQLAQLLHTLLEAGN